MTRSGHAPAARSRLGHESAAGGRTRSITPRHTIAAVACLCALALAGGAVLPTGPAGPREAEAATQLDAATARAVVLQDRLDSLTEEQVAVQLRIDDTAAKLRAQTKTLSKAREDAEAAQARLHSRAVVLYKADELDTMALLLTSDDWSDLVTRSDLMRRLLADDARLVAEARRVTADAEQQAKLLAEIQQESLALRRIHRQRVASARAALAEQRRIVATLSAEQRRLLEARKAASVATKKKTATTTRTSSAPSIKIGPVTVLPDRVFQAPSYFPKTFATTGKQFTGLASWMGAGIDGHNTASGRRFNHNDYTCAHRTLPFGTYLALTRNGKRCVVVVTDRGPYTGGRVLDLSQASAKYLGIDGVSTVKAEVVKPQ